MEEQDFLLREKWNNMRTGFFNKKREYVKLSFLIADDTFKIYYNYGDKIWVFKILSKIKNDDLYVLTREIMNETYEFSKYEKIAKLTKITKIGGD